MAKLILQCPYCAKPLELVSSSPLGNQTLEKYACGHSFIKDKVTAREATLLHSTDNQLEAFDYQKDGVKFVMDSDFNCLIADQMGLGKTIQSLLALRNQYDNLNPCLILVKSSTIWQWQREYKKWCDPSLTGVWVIEGTKGFIPPGFHTYLLSMDTIARTGVIDRLLAFDFKLTIVDECHSFKNPESKRSQALMQFFKRINSVELIQEVPFTCMLCKHQWQEEIKAENSETKTFVDFSSFCPSCNAEVRARTFRERVDVPERKCKVILLSGTPIINRADEYFVPLNILAPQVFPSLDRFRKNWLEQNEKGKWARVKQHRLDEFKETIAPFVIRRERNEVLKDLPPFQRTFTTISMDEDGLKKLYNLEIEKMLEKQGDRELSVADISDNIASMRRITGLAKVGYVIDYVLQFLDETEAEKIVLGIHHRDVRYALKAALGKLHPLTLSGEDSPAQKDYIVQTFKRPEKRLLICNTLAGGVGLNLQFCNNALVLERQWSSAYEEQFEGRFNRPGQTLPVTCEYLLIKNSIDEFFHNIVEEKRAIFGETVENNYAPMEDGGVAQRFVDWSAANRF